MPEEYERDEEEPVRVGIESVGDMAEFITVPTIDKAYREYVTKDMAVSYFKSEKWVQIVMKYFSLIEDFIFIKTPNIAKTYDAELKALITSLRSVDGFERERLTTITQVVKRVSETKKEAKGWFRR